MARNWLSMNTSICCHATQKITIWIAVCFPLRVNRPLFGWPCGEGLGKYQRYKSVLSCMWLGFIHTNTQVNLIRIISLNCVLFQNALKPMSGFAPRSSKACQLQSNSRPCRRSALYSIYWLAPLRDETIWPSRVILYQMCHIFVHLCSKWDSIESTENRNC